jgi:hypothetical protein
MSDGTRNDTPTGATHRSIVQQRCQENLTAVVYSSIKDLAATREAAIERYMARQDREHREDAESLAGMISTGGFQVDTHKKELWPTTLVELDELKSKRVTNGQLGKHRVIPCQDPGTYVCG